MIIENYIKKKGAILQFGEYYLSYYKDLIDILEYFKAKNLKVGIWGAGLKGTAFLNKIDKKGRYIDIVVDLNKSIYGTYITPYHKVIGYKEFLLNPTDVIFIMNAAHYADNYALLKENNYSGLIIDMDYLIENKISSSDIINNKIKNSQQQFDLSKVHDVLLEILKEVDRICKKHNITYFLSAGTALGAVRHHGFIPWDDDADIGMLREDFEKFRKVVKEELSSNFYFQTMRKGSDYYRAFDQIGKKNTSFVLESTKNLKIYHGIHVDIFPFDYVSGETYVREKHVKEVQLYRKKLSSKLIPYNVNSRNLFHKFFINYEYYKMKLVPYNYLHNKMESALKKYQGKEDIFVADLLTHYKKIMYFKKIDIVPVKYVDFEDVKLPIPNNYHEYLTMMYGDYMVLPPEGKRNQRHKLIEISADKGYEGDNYL